MGFFDFLKRNELKQISHLESELAKTREENDILIAENKSLSRFVSVRDAEAEAKKIIVTANNEAKEIISKANIESTEIINKANSTYADASSKYEEADIYYNKTKEQADITIEAELRAAKDNVLKAKLEAKNKLNEASEQVATIIKNAQIKAEQVAGDAYKAMKESENLSKTITALRNTIKGYGDDYIMPTFSLLDQLAEDFGYTEAGEELKKARERSRLMVKNDISASCDYVEDNRRITAMNFCTDAFNGKVDSVLSTVKQDNFGTLKQKIVDAYHLVNNLGKSFRNAVITESYLEARIDELKWAVIVIELRNKEREEQRRIKEQIREEERAKREFEKALKDAEKEENAIQKALAKAKAELKSASEAQKQKYEAKLLELEDKLKEAELRGERAKSMAEQTKSGHVYVISNIGSFGENIYKIGMTRRL